MGACEHHGSVRDLVDSSNTLRNHIDYDTSGRVLYEANSNFRTAFWYTGRERDDETGMQYQRQRY